MISNHRAQLNKAYDEKVVKKLDHVVRGTALLALGELKVNTPVLTGRARSNWHIDLNQVDVSLVEPGTEPNRGVVNSYKINDTIYISNNLPYIRRLNEGHSQQSPAGFVDAAIQVAKRKAAEL